MKTQRQVINAISERARLALLKQENQDARALALAYRRAQDSVQNSLRGIYAEGPWELTSIKAAGRGQRLLSSVNGAIADLQAESIGIIERAAVAQYQQSYLWHGYLLDQGTPPNIGITFGTIPEKAVVAMVNSPFKGAMFSQRIGMVSDAMAADIRDELTQSVINGEGMAAASYRVRDVFGAYNLDNPKNYAARADSIARSEIMRAMSAARDHVYSQNKDLIDDDEWLATPDDRMCEWCMSRDGKSESEFTPKSGDPNGKSWEQPLHPRCRCTKVPRLKSWKSLLGYDMPEGARPDERGMRNEDGKWIVAPVQKFDAWKAQRIGGLQ